MKKDEILVIILLMFLLISSGLIAPLSVVDVGIKVGPTEVRGSISQIDQVHAIWLFLIFIILISIVIIKITERKRHK